MLVHTGDQLRRAPTTDWVWLLSVVAVWSGLFGYSTWHGLSMTPDSWHYVAAAKSFSAKGELLNPNGTLYTAWPPFFPVVLAAWADIIPLHWKWLQGGCLAASLLVWGYLGQQLLVQQFWVRLYSVVLAFSTPWLICGGFLWSEPLFILLLSGYLCALYHYKKHGSAMLLLLATVCGILLPLQRVSGFFVLAGVGLGVAIVYPAGAWRHRWRLLLHGCLTVGVGCIWQYYTLVMVASRELSGIHHWSMLVEAASDFGHAMGRWLVPLIGPAQRGYGWYALIFLLLNAVGFALPGPRFLRLLGIMVPVVLLPLVPLAWLGQSGIGLTDADRYTAVMYAPIFLLLFTHAQRFINAQSIKRQRIIVFLSLCWLLYPAARMMRNSIYLNERKPVAASALRLP